MVNQFMGPGGPGGGSGYDADKNKPVVTYSTAANNAAAAQAALQNVIDNKNQSPGFSTAPGVVAIPTMGKKTGKFKDIEEKLTTQGYGSLTPGEQMIADFYLSSAVNPYQQQMQNFIESSPAAAQAYAERFPKTTFLKNIVPMAMGSVTGVPLGIVNAISKGYGAAKEGLGSLAQNDQGLLGFLASIPGNIAAQFKPEQVTKLKAIAKERDPISTLQTGPMDPNAYGAIGGDRFDVEEDVFQSTSPNVETVYNPGTPLDNYLKQQEINERDYPLLKKLKDRENIAKEVEEATEQVVPGQFNLNYVRPDAPTVNLSGVNDEEIQDLFIDENQSVADLDQQTVDNMIGAYYGKRNVINFPFSPGAYFESQSSGAPQDTGYGSSFETVVPGGFPFDPNTGSASIPTKFYSDQIAVPENIPFGANTTNFDYKDGGYLNKFDDGGYANMSTYQKLKMMADSLG